MATITTRAGKGSPLTNNEVDANFTNLNSDKIESTDLSVTQNSASGTGTLSYTGGVFTYTPPDLSGFLNNEGIEDSVANLLQAGLSIEFTYDDINNELTADVPKIEAQCKNTTVSTIAVGTPVYQTGSTGGNIDIAPADASDSAKMPAIGVVSADITSGSEGTIVLLGEITGIDTSAFSEGDIMYVASGGGFTSTRPTGSSVLVQNLGRVTKVHASNGGGIVTGAGRSNDIPNLANNYVFIGNGTDAYEMRQLTSDDLSDVSSIAMLDEAETFTAKPTFSAGIDVTGNIAVTGTVDGRDVAADGTKLDGIESGATADQTASEILTAVKTVDGAGSGLDADLLDGQQGSYYTTYTDTAVANLVDSAPATLDTLNELAAALGDDPNFATTVTNSIALKAPIASPTFTGTVTIPAATVTGDVSFGDNDKAIFGAGSDLEIYHDGSQSIIADVGTGPLVIKGGNNGIISLENGNGETMLSAAGNGSVDLYYDNAVKFATTSTGIDVTGTVTADGLTVDTDTLYVDATNNRVGIGTSSPAYDIEVNKNAATSIIGIRSSDTGEARIQFGDQTSGNVGRIGYDNTDNSMAFRVNNAERLRIDSSGNVGIGTSSPSSLYAGARNLVVGSGSGEAGMTIYSSATNYGNIYFADGTSGSAPYAGYIEYNHTNNFMRFGANAAEKMRIDSSGNLLVGKTAVDNTTVGIRLDGGLGLLSAVRDGAAPLLGVRKSSDGDIIEFRKDTTTVGSIGSNSSTTYIAGDASGIRLGSTAFMPSTTTGANKDDAVDLGHSSVRFKDLYLSGEVSAATADFSTSATIDGHVLQDSSDRSGLLGISTALGTWKGIQIIATSTALWSIMGDQDDFGIYDDINGEWIFFYNENGSSNIYHNGVAKLSTLSGGVDIHGSIYVDAYMYHSGDTNSYLGFSAADDFRIVVGGRQIIRCDEGTDPDKIQFFDSSNYIDTGGNLAVTGTVIVNAVTYTGTDGTAGQVLTTDGSGNATFADAAGGGALELISSTTIGTAVSTVDITSGFSSSYDTYMIDVTGVAKNVARDANVELQIYDNGTLLTGANYDFKDESAANVNGANEFTIGEFDLASNDNGVNFTIRNANDATWYVESMGGRRIYMLGGWYDQSTGPVTGFRLSLSRDDMTGGTIRLYGLKNS